MDISSQHFNVSDCVILILVNRLSPDSPDCWFRSACCNLSCLCWHTSTICDPGGRYPSPEQLLKRASAVKPPADSGVTSSVPLRILPKVLLPAKLWMNSEMKRFCGDSCLLDSTKESNYEMNVFSLSAECKPTEPLRRNESTKSIHV